MAMLNHQGVHSSDLAIFFPPNWVKKQQRQRQRQDNDNDNDNDNNNKLQSRHGWMVPVSEVEVGDRFK
jgi:hypothetical protein